MFKKVCVDISADGSLHGICDGTTFTMAAICFMTRDAEPFPTGALETDEEAKQSLNNLCGDLNEGRLPLNPMGQSVLGHSYPL